MFRALVFIEKNQEMLYLREASMKIYGNSKYFEENTLGTVCSLIREYRQQPCQENELADEILLEYGILKEEPTLCIKGCVTIGIGGKELNLSLLPGGMEFCAKDLEKLDYIKVRDQSGYSGKQNILLSLSGTGYRIFLSRRICKSVSAGIFENGLSR